MLQSATPITSNPLPLQGDTAKVTVNH